MTEKQASPNAVREWGADALPPPGLYITAEGDLVSLRYRPPGWIRAGSRAVVTQKGKAKASFDAHDFWTYMNRPLYGPIGLLGAEGG